MPLDDVSRLPTRRASCRPSRGCNAGTRRPSCSSWSSRHETMVRRDQPRWLGRRSSGRLGDRAASRHSKSSGGSGADWQQPPLERRHQKGDSQACCLQSTPPGGETSDLLGTRGARSVAAAGSYLKGVSLPSLARSPLLESAAPGSSGLQGATFVLSAKIYAPDSVVKPLAQGENRGLTSSVATLGHSLPRKVETLTFLFGHGRISRIGWGRFRQGPELGQP